jgi:hypothetical protein
MMRLLPLLSASMLLAASVTAQDPAPSTMWQTAGQADFINLGANLRGTNDVNGDGVDDLLSISPNADLGGLSRTGVITALSGTDGSTLWQYSGWQDSQYVGRHVSYPGDLDGDGVDDLLVGEPEVSANGLIENGRTTALRGTDATILWQNFGTANHARLGEQAVTLGDLDGDGITDLLMGMPTASTGLLFQNGSVMAVSGAWGTPIWLAQGGADNEMLGAELKILVDLDSDSTPEIASLSPEASSNGLYQNGILTVLSGANGSTHWRKEGTQGFEYVAQAAKAGADLNADGVAEILVRAPGGSTGGWLDNGWAEMLSGADGSSLWRVEGSAHGMNFGATSIRIDDVDSDGQADFALSAPGASALGLVENGRVEAFSAMTGASLWFLNGPVNYGRLGTGLASTEDWNADTHPDLITGLSSADTLGRIDNGYLLALDAQNGALIWRKDGAVSGEQMGTTVLQTEDFSGDGIGDLLLGSQFADVGGLLNNGEILGLDGTNGAVLWSVSGTESEELLGKDMVTRPDIDGDGGRDFLAFSPFSDTQGLRDNGLVKAFNMSDGSLIWRYDGGRDGSRTGTTRLLSFDHDRDGVQDLILGSGVTDFGAYRGNGAVIALSVGRTLTLDINNLVAGGIADFDCSGFVPDSNVTFLASIIGPGPTQVGPGYVVALSAPIYNLGATTANASGDASLSLAVPPSVAGATVWFQAIQDDNGTRQNSNQVRLVVQ